MSSPWYFACDSDQHYVYPVGNPDGQPISRKGDIVNKITTLNNQYGLDLLICPGDTTDQGADGSKMCSCCSVDILGNQYNAFISKYVVPISSLGINVKICPGNHDINKWTYPNVSILKYIRDTYNGTYSWCQTENSACYKFIHKGFTFICMGIYPKNLNWLKNNLPTNKSEPVIIFYHYNTNPTEPFADWWTEKEKQAFYDIISSHNIKLIINGHWHTSRTGIWNNIPYLLCAGEPVVVEIIGQDLLVL